MADNNTILEKLEGLVARFEEVSTLITDPAVIADQKRYVKLTKEYKELGDLMNARTEYMQVLSGIEEAKEIIANETDFADDKALTKAIRANLKDQIMDYMMPTQFVYVDSFPTSANGKIAVKQMIAEANE